MWEGPQQPANGHEFHPGTARVSPTVIQAVVAYNYSERRQVKKYKNLQNQPFPIDTIWCCILAILGVCRCGRTALKTLGYIYPETHWTMAATTAHSLCLSRWAKAYLIYTLTFQTSFITVIFIYHGRFYCQGQQPSRFVFWRTFFPLLNTTGNTLASVILYIVKWFILVSAIAS